MDMHGKCFNSHGNAENGPLLLIADFSQLIVETDCLTMRSESQTLYLELGHERIPQGTVYQRELRSSLLKNQGPFYLFEVEVYIFFRLEPVNQFFKIIFYIPSIRKQ